MLSSFRWPVKGLYAILWKLWWSFLDRSVAFGFANTGCLRSKRTNTIGPRCSSYVRLGPQPVGAPSKEPVPFQVYKLWLGILFVLKVGSKLRHDEESLALGVCRAASLYVLASTMFGMESQLRWAQRPLPAVMKTTYET
jgi:hypothetical protein